MITGASGGIGAAGVRHFVDHGAHVVGLDVVDGPGEQLFAELGAPHVYRHVDLTNADDVATALRAAAEHLGGLDVLWLNAGTVLDRSMLQSPTAVAACVVALLDARDTGDAWTALPDRPPVRIRFPELRGRGFKLEP